MKPKYVVRWTCQNGELPYGETWGKQELSETQQRQVQGQHNQKSEYRLGSVWLGISLAGRDLGLLADNKLSKSQQCPATATKTNQTLGCTHSCTTNRDRAGSHPSTQSSSGHAWLLCPVLSPQSIRWQGQHGEGPKAGHEEDRRQVMSTSCIGSGFVFT